MWLWLKSSALMFSHWREYELLYNSDNELAQNRQLHVSERVKIYVQIIEIQSSNIISTTASFASAAFTAITQHF